MTMKVVNVQYRNDAQRAAIQRAMGNRKPTGSGCFMAAWSVQNCDVDYEVRADRVAAVRARLARIAPRVFVTVSDVEEDA